MRTTEMVLFAPFLLLKLLYLRIFSFWFMDFLVSFKLQFNLKIYILASCCYMAKYYLGELLLG